MDEKLKEEFSKYIKDNLSEYIKEYLKNNLEIEIYRHNKEIHIDLFLDGISFCHSDTFL
jgi:uncharacterized protein (DUF2164 family)